MKYGLKANECDWVIMSAGNWIKGRPSIEKIIKENNSEGIILVVEREDYGYNNSIKIFVLGSEGDYGKIGEKVTFVKDTGNGYGQTGWCIIHNIIKISNNKIVDEGNGIGVDEKRPLWVFK